MHDKKVAEYEPNLAEVALDHPMTAEENGHITIEFFKYLLFQKGQISLAFPSLLKTVDQIKHRLNLTEDQTSGDSASRKDRLIRLQQRRIETKFLKAAHSFIQKFSAISERIEEEFSNRTTTIAILFGTSIFTARDVFVLNLPCPVDRTNGQSTSANGMKENLSCIFRFLVCDDTLGSALNSINPTLVHVMCWKDLSPCSCSDDLLPRPGYRFPPRCRVLTVNFTNRPKSPQLSKQSLACKRLSFAAPDRDCTPEDSFHELLLEISGIAILDPEEVSLPILPSSKVDSCWFQLNHKLKGFKCKL